MIKPRHRHSCITEVFLTIFITFFTFFSQSSIPGINQFFEKLSVILIDYKNEEKFDFIKKNYLESFKALELPKNQLSFDRHINFKVNLITQHLNIFNVFFLYLLSSITDVVVIISSHSYHYHLKLMSLRNSGISIWWLTQCVVRVFTEWNMKWIKIELS